MVDGRVAAVVERRRRRWRRPVGGVDSDQTEMVEQVRRARTRGHAALDLISWRLGEGGRADRRGRGLPHFDRLAMDRLQRLFQGLPMGGGGGAGPDGPVGDTAEKVTISSLALLKMLKHGRNRPARR